MKNRVAIIIGSLIAVSIFCSLNLSAKDRFMNLAAAEKKWGKGSFSAQEFKNGTIKTRAVMSVDLIKSKVMLGKTPEETKKILGEFTGYYWNHNVPAYIIEEGVIKPNELKMTGDVWQLVFLLNKSGTVEEVKIHKNN